MHTVIFTAFGKHKKQRIYILRTAEQHRCRLHTACAVFAIDNLDKVML